MMGLGYLGSSSASSSSSSNLSPLAPPFTVDRSNPNKPNLNSNPLTHFKDPSYGVPFSSNWPYSHSSTARQDFLADSIRTATVPSANDYGYMSPEPINSSTTPNWSGLNSNIKPGSEPINPPGTLWSAVNPSPKPVTDSFTYNATEAKPFYPPYVSSVANDDIPLVAFDEPGYDLLSTSGLVRGNASSPIDYTQSLSGLDYNPQWDGIWNRLPEGKRGKKMECDGSFFSEETSITGSLAYKNYMNQGTYGAETLSKGKEESAMFPGSYADLVRREYNVGPSKSDGTSFSAKNHGLSPNEFLNAPAYRAFPMFSESQPLVPFREPSEEPWNIQNSFTLYEKRFHMFDGSNDHNTPSATKSSPLLIKPPAGVSTFAPNDVVGSHNPLQEKELHLPLGFEAEGSFLASNQPIFRMGRTDEPIVVALSSKEEDTSNKLPTNHGLNFEFKAKSNSQVPDINIPNVNGTEKIKSTANSSERLDHHNPAEDSPCWKGAPSAHFSPFGSPDPESPQHPMKKLQMSNCVNVQGSQADHSFDHSSKFSSSEPHESNDSNERIPVPSPTDNACRISEAVGVGSSCAKAISNKGVHYSCDNINPRKEPCLLSESTSGANSRTFHLKSPNREEDASSAERKIPLTDGGMDCNAVHAVESVLLSSVEDAENHETADKINVNILVKALHNLSELLLLHCSNDECTLKEQDRKALDRVIDNLDVCISRKIQSSTSQRFIPSNMFEEVTNEIACTFHGQAGCQCVPDEKQNHAIVGKNAEKLQGCASLRDKGDSPKDHNMVQAIKKLLDENFESNEELPPQTLLYKNLWLEAEAEMCAFNYRARFERMKREMDIYKSRKATGLSEITAAMKKISSSNGTRDPKIHPKPIHEADGSNILNTHVENPPFLIVDSHIDDVDPSVMARFNILKRRGATDSFNVKEQELAEVEISGEGNQSSGAHVGPNLKHPVGDAVVMHSHGNQTMQHQFGSGLDDVKPSVMGRLNILKRRGESDPGNVEEQAPADDEVFGKGRESPSPSPSPSPRPSSSATLGPYFRHPAGKEDAVGMHCHGTSELESGWYNTCYSASDWEHVLKDEFSWRSDGR